MIYDDNLIEEANRRLDKDDKISCNSIEDLILSEKIGALYDSYSEDKVIYRLGMENYILKNYNKVSIDPIRAAIDIVKKKILQGFESNPLKYYDSLLLKKENAVKIFSISDYQKLENYNSVLNKRLKGIVDDGPSDQNERHLMMKHFNMNINVDDKNQEKYIREILSSNNIPTDPEEVSFLLSFIKHFIFRKLETDFNIYPVVLRDPLIESHDWENYIFVNLMDGEQSLVKLIHLFIHRARHVMQNYEMRSNSNLVNPLDFAKRQLFNKYFDENFSCKSMSASSLERGASEFADLRCDKFIRKFGIPEQINELELIKKSSDITFSFQHLTDDNDNIYPSEIMYSYLLDQIVKKHPNVLKDYAILNDLYDENGEVLGFEQLIKKRSLSSFSTYKSAEITFGHGIAYINAGELDNLDFNKLDEDEVQVVLTNLDYYLFSLNEQLSKMNQIINLNDYPENNVIISNDLYRELYLRYAKIAVKISSFLEMYFDKLKYGNMYIGNKEWTFSNIKTLLQNLKSNIHNPISIESGLSDDLQEGILTLRKIYSSVRLKYNRNRVINQLDKIVPSEKQQELVKYHGKTYSLRDYVESKMADKVFPDLRLSVLEGDEKVPFEKHILSVLEGKFSEEGVVTPIPSFNELIDLYNDYILLNDKDDSGSISYRNLKSGEIGNYSDMIQNILFAKYWENAAGQKWDDSLFVNTDLSAFSSTKEDLYGFLCKAIEVELKEFGDIDVEHIVSEAKKQGYSSYEKIIYNLLGNRTKSLNFVENYFRMKIEYQNSIENIESMKERTK